MAVDQVGQIVDAAAYQFLATGEIAYSIEQQVTGPAHTGSQIQMDQSPEKTSQPLPTGRQEESVVRLDQVSKFTLVNVLVDGC